MKRSLAAAVMIVSASALAGAAETHPAAATKRSQTPLTVREVPELGGYLGQRWRANREGYLAEFDIESQLRIVEQRKHRDWWWIGEQTGKWLESAVLATAHTDDDLHRRAKNVLDRLVASQEPGGYIGVTDPALRNREHPLRGMDAYELYFLMHGLLTAWEQWNDAGALAAARKLGDYFVAHIGPGKAEFWPSPLRPPDHLRKSLSGTSEIAGHSVHYGWEGTLLTDPMLRLAALSGEPRYANWSRWVVSRIDTWSGWDSFSRLDEVAAGRLGVHELQPYVHSHTFHMNFLGFLRLYEATGDASLLRKVAGAWADIARRQMYVTGGVSVAEHYEAGSLKPISGHAVETCATMSWLQVTQALLELTGEAVYADAMEKLLWNHVFASQAQGGDGYRYHTPPNGDKPAGYHRGPDCCNGSGHRMVSLLPTYLYGRNQQGLFINQYAASVADVSYGARGRLRIRQETGYPQASQVRVLLESVPDCGWTLHLRLPSWCRNPSLRLNGVAQQGLRPGTYWQHTRRWVAGDVVELELPMTPHWVRSDSDWLAETYRLPGGEIMHRPVKDGSVPWALVRGPLVYAVDTFWRQGTSLPADGRIWEDVAVVPELASVREFPGETPADTLGPFFQVEGFDVKGQPVKLPMVPFTNLGYGCTRSAAQERRAWSYAIWLLDPQAPAFKKRSAIHESERQRYAKAVDYVLVGDSASEQAHQVSGGEVGAFRERSFRAGRDFSYTLKVPTDRSARLIVMYWGGDRGREFDLYADDRRIDTCSLEHPKPGEFFERSCTIPHELVKDRTDASGQKVDTIRLRFRSRNDDVAGGVFGIRTE